VQTCKQGGHSYQYVSSSYTVSYYWCDVCGALKRENTRLVLNMKAEPERVTTEEVFLSKIAKNGVFVSKETAENLGWYLLVMLSFIIAGVCCYITK
jgi:hypothetical protein